jgi:hypothetical protein
MGGRAVDLLVDPFRTTGTRMLVLHQAYIKPPTQTDYWDDLSPYAKAIVEIIESAWNHFSSAVDIAVSTAQI